MYIKYFIVFYIALVVLFSLGYHAAGMMGHNIINKGNSLVFAVDSELHTQLNVGQIPEIMRQKFKILDNQLSDSTTVSPEVLDSKWMMVDGDRTYTIIKRDDRLDVHELCIRSPRDFVYFSIITATTLGYGDLFPSGWLTRVLSILEVSFGVIFITVVLTVALGSRHTPVQGGR